MRIGIISDIHEDIISLNLALEELKNEGVDVIFCLGDIVGFSTPYYDNYKDTRDAKACIERIEEVCKISVVGNHDLFAIKKIPKYNNNFTYPDNWYELSPAQRKKMSKKKIFFYEDNESKSNASRKQYSFLEDLREYEKYNTENITILLSHFIYPDFSGSCTYFPKSKRFFKKHLEFMKLNDCQISFNGHGHPEGLIIGTKNKFKVLPFGNYKVDVFPISISIPCIAGSYIENAITIFDSETYHLNVIPLGKSINRNSKYETIR